MTIVSKDLHSCRFKRCFYYSRCSRKAGQNGAVCECDSQVDAINSPVCGTNGRTFKNEKALQSYACNNKKNIILWHKGACVVGEFVQEAIQENVLY